MKLYKITRIGETDWDEYYGAVVAAVTPAEAKLIHPCATEFLNHVWKNGKWQIQRDDGSWFNASGGWVPLEKIKVELIGEAKKGTKKGLILSDYRAG